MKVAIPVNSNDEKTTICVSFGRAPYFAVYDVNQNKFDFVDNHLAVSSHSGAGTKAAQCVVNAEVSYVIAPRCGENAAKVFELAQITLYLSEGDNLLNNIQAFNEGKLQKMQTFHPGFHGKGPR